MRVVHNYSAIATVVGASPVPYADMPVLAGIQIKMVSDIARAIGYDISAREAATITTTIGAGGYACREIARQSLKHFPGIGWVISGGIAGAGTEVFGRAAIRFFQDQQVDS